MKRTRSFLIITFAFVIYFINSNFIAVNATELKGLNEPLITYDENGNAILSESQLQELEESIHRAMHSMSNSIYTDADDITWTENDIELKMIMEKLAENDAELKAIMENDNLNSGKSDVLSESDSMITPYSKTCPPHNTMPVTQRSKTGGMTSEYCYTFSGRTDDTCTTCSQTIYTYFFTGGKVHEFTYYSAYKQCWICHYTVKF